MGSAPTPLDGLAIRPGPQAPRGPGAAAMLAAPSTHPEPATHLEPATQPEPATHLEPATIGARRPTVAGPAAPPAASGAPVPNAPRSRARAVDLLTVAMAAVGGALFAADVVRLPARSMHVAALIAVAAAFAIADLARVDFEIGDHSATMTLSHTMFVLSMLLLGPVGAVAARTVGGVAVLTPYWRGRRRKLFFNAALYALEATAGVSIFFAIAGAQPEPTATRTWCAAATAVVTCSVLTASLVAAVIRLADASATVPIGSIVGLGLIGETANTALGIIAAIVIDRSPRSIVLMAIPAAVVYAAYRGYVRLTERHKSLARLYQFTTELQRSPELFATLRTTIRETAQTLRARRADVLLVTGGPGDAGLWVTLDAAGNLSPFGEVDRWRDHADVAAVITAGAGARLAVDSTGVDAVIAPIIVRGSVIGTLAARDRLGHAALFTDEDITVLATLANHTAVSLENSLLNEELQVQAVEREQQALHDTLTGLANRRAFEHDLKASLHAAGAEARPGAVIVIDLRGFKDINETLGHEAGDRLLLVVAERLLAVCEPAHGEQHLAGGCSPSAPKAPALSARLSAGTLLGEACQHIPSSRDRAELARLGGDEFAIVIQPCTASEAMAVAQRVHSEIERPIVLNGLQLVVGAAIGIACFPDQAGDEITLMQRADAALASAKERPEEPIQLYANHHDRSTARRLTLAADLREAIEREDLLVYYQPQAELATRRIVAVEALLRWHHPTLGWIAPDEFIAVAEGVGLIGKVTRYVMARAIAQAAAWSAAGIDIELSVNVSARNLLEDSLPADIGELLHRHRVRGSQVTIEITETEIMRDPERTIDVLDQLNSLGLRVSIDDFGTGYSSLAYLRRLPVTEVKIDKSFVLQMDTNPNDAMLAKTIVDLAANLSMRVVAEGIESQASWDALRTMGCERGQGFVFARPMPAIEVTNLLRDASVA